MNAAPMDPLRRSMTYHAQSGRNLTPRQRRRIRKAYRRGKRMTMPARGSS